MKVIEVVVLMGAHCISPVETTTATTEAVKVQCAVVIEKDVNAGTVRIVPAAASTRPEVAAGRAHHRGEASAAEGAATRRDGRRAGGSRPLAC